MMFEPIRVIRRPKRSGVGTHFGVQFPSGIVYDYTYEEGFRQVTLERFSDGVPTITVREIPWHMAYIVHARLEEVRRNPREYHLLEWNCETFAEWLTSGIAKSAQVTGIGFLIVMTLTLAVATRVNS